MEIRAITKIRTAEQGVEHALESFKRVSRNDPGRATNLRVSSLPFCATKWWLSLPTVLTGVREETFQSAYFTGIGTHVHTQVQGALDSSPFVIRDWQCARCKHRHEFVTRPKSCAGCGGTQTFMHSLEHEIRKGCIVGHIDDAFLLADGTIYIPDYKTTSDAKAAGTKLPNLENVRQIEVYAAIKKQQGHPVSSWTLCYIPRNSGARKYVTAKKFYGHSFLEEYPAILKRIRSYVKDYKDIAGLTDQDDLPEILARRRLTATRKDVESLCSYCPYTSLCTNEKSLEKQSSRVFKLMSSRLPVYPVKS